MSPLDGGTRRRHHCGSIIPGQKLGQRTLHMTGFSDTLSPTTRQPRKRLSKRHFAALKLVSKKHPISFVESTQNAPCDADWLVISATNVGIIFWLHSTGGRLPLVARNRSKLPLKLHLTKRPRGMCGHIGGRLERSGQTTQRSIHHYYYK